MTFPIALAQINATVGDIAGNVKKILTAYERARAEGAELVVFPECAVIGYPPEDLVLMPAFRQAAMEAARALAVQTKNGPAMILGSVWEENTHIINAALLLDEGQVQHVQPKHHLPNYGVFDEARLFTPGEPNVVRWRGRMLGLLVCEDTWHVVRTEALAKAGAEILISINASPFEIGKMEARRKIVSDAVRVTGLPLVYVNLVGGQDDIVFDGGSFVMNAAGEVVMQLKQFEVDSGWWIVDGDKATAFTNHQPLSTNHQLWHAMRLGLRDYVEKNSFSGVLIGLSGGVDSALTAALAVDALGSKRVHGVLLPSPYTSKESVEDAEALARVLGITTNTIAITPGMLTMEEVLSPVFKDAAWMEDVAVGGNLQARLRGVTLMALSNKTGFMLLSTGNKSEIAVGYTTLYGDSCGGYNVLKDLYKTQVYALARWRGGLPERTLTKAPTAELKPNQKDQDQLPPYETLDAILALHIEQRHSASEIIKRGFDAETVEKMVKLVRLSEYKRRQSCPGPKLSPMLFGKDRRFPLTNQFKG